MAGPAEPEIKDIGEYYVPSAVNESMTDAQRLAIAVNADNLEVPAKLTYNQQMALPAVEGGSWIPSGAKKDAAEYHATPDPSGYNRGRPFQDGHNSTYARFKHRAISKLTIWKTKREALKGIEQLVNVEILRARKKLAELEARRRTILMLQIEAEHEAQEKIALGEDPDAVVVVLEPAPETEDV